jgi:RNA polymerase sigma-70 factor, ECF subfamily
MLGPLVLPCDGRRQTKEMAASDPRNMPQGQCGFGRGERKHGQDGAGIDDLSEVEILRAISRGDRAALARLFRSYAQMIRVTAMRILRDAGEAEDLVQEVFLFVFQRAALFDPVKGSARSWLIQIAYHRAFDRRRHLIARHFYSNLELGETMLHSEEPAAQVSSYEDTIEAAVGRDGLRRIEESLSPDQRQVLGLHFVEGYTMQEIAAMMGHSLANVRNHYYRALEKIRREVFAVKGPQK